MIAVSLEHLPRGKVGVTDKSLKRTAECSLRFKDLSVAGGRSRSNILFYPADPSGSGWQDSGLLGCQPARQIDKIRVAAPMPDLQQTRTCGMEINEAG